MLCRKSLKAFSSKLSKVSFIITWTLWDVDIIIAFNDQFIDDSRQKSNDTSQEYAIIESITKEHDELW